MGYIKSVCGAVVNNSGEASQPNGCSLSLKIEMIVGYGMRLRSNNIIAMQGSLVNLGVLRMSNDELRDILNLIKQVKDDLYMLHTDSYKLRSEVVASTQAAESIRKNELYEKVGTDKYRLSDAALTAYRLRLLPVIMSNVYCLVGEHNSTMPVYNGIDLYPIICDRIKDEETKLHVVRMLSDMTLVSASTVSTLLGLFSLKESERETVANILSQITKASLYTSLDEHINDLIEMETVFKYKNGLSTRLGGIWDSIINSLALQGTPELASVLSKETAVEDCSTLAIGIARSALSSKCLSCTSSCLINPVASILEGTLVGGHKEGCTIINTAVNSFQISPHPLVTRMEFVKCLEKVSALVPSEDTEEDNKE